MKKTIILLIAMTFILTLAGCEGTTCTKIVVKKEFIPAHTSIETHTENKYNWLAGKWQYVPITESVDHPDTWELTIKSQYEGMESKEETTEVSEDIYNRYNEGDTYTEK